MEVPIFCVVGRCICHCVTTLQLDKWNQWHHPPIATGAPPAGKNSTGYSWCRNWKSQATHLPEYRPPATLQLVFFSTRLFLPSKKSKGWAAEPTFTGERNYKDLQPLFLKWNHSTLSRIPGTAETKNHSLKLEQGGVGCRMCRMVPYFPNGNQPCRKVNKNRCL